MKLRNGKSYNESNVIDGLIFTPLYKEHENPQKWTSKVSASINEIRNALIELGRKPKNLEELDQKITQLRRRYIAQILEEAEAGMQVSF